ncbi:DUF4124 domain-containing protein [Geomonas oryzae]|uniref:DUF4124 domain-containing protein n=1 Tax=Geomonas oryzae TaxID=2364273 RepID=UPI00100BC49E|nr:DUF4124 domain-containing protein [Geomonas oryzae]
MRHLLLSLLILALLSPSPARAAFYQWTDAEGVVHFTDNRSNIPKQYLDRARRVEVSDKATTVAPPAGGTVRQEPQQKPAEPGGHGERWWRDRYKALRSELKSLQDGRAGKEQALEELRRKRTFFHKASDRQAINVMEADIAGDDAKISEMLNRIQALDLAAAQAGVPLEWRQ